MRSIPLALLAAFAVACSDDGGDAPPGPDPTSPVGQWSSAVSLQACFAADGRASVGDHEEELADPCCTWDDEGVFVGEDFSAVWSIGASGELTIEVPGCDDPTECGPFTFSRAQGLPCFQ